MRAGCGRTAARWRLKQGYPREPAARSHAIDKDKPLSDVQPLTRRLGDSPAWFPLPSPPPSSP